MTPGATLLAVLGVVAVGAAIIGGLDYYFVRRPVQERDEQ